METAVKEAPVQVRKAPPIPPREPEGETDWRITVRHCPLPVKSLIVRAKGRKAAWDQFLKDAETRIAKLESAMDKREPGRLGMIREWFASAKKTIPEGTEIIGAEYARERVKALRVKGTITTEQIGFPELASA